MEAISVMALLDRKGSGGGTGSVFLGYLTDGATVSTTRPSGEEYVSGDYYMTKTAGSVVTYSGTSYTFTTIRDRLVWTGDTFVMVEDVTQNTAETPLKTPSAESFNSSDTKQYNANVTFKAKINECFELIKQCGYTLEGSYSAGVFTFTLKDWNGDTRSTFTLQIEAVQNVVWNSTTKKFTITKIDGTVTNVDLSDFATQTFVTNLYNTVTQEYKNYTDTAVTNNYNTVTSEYKTYVDNSVTNNYTKVTKEYKEYTDEQITNVHNDITNEYKTYQTDEGARKIDLSFSGTTLKVDLQKKDGTSLSSDSIEANAVTGGSISGSVITLTKRSGSDTITLPEYATEEYVDEHDEYYYDQSKSYTDTKITNLNTTLRTVISEGDSTTLETAESYSDTNLVTSKTYTDGQITILKGLALGSVGLEVSDGQITLLAKPILGLTVSVTQDNEAMIDVDSLPESPVESMFYRMETETTPSYYSRLGLTSSATTLGYTVSESGLTDPSSTLYKWTAVNEQWDTGLNFSQYFESSTTGDVYRYSWDNSTWSIAWQTLPTKTVPKVYHKYEGTWYEVGSGSGGGTSGDYLPLIGGTMSGTIYSTAETTLAHKTDDGYTYVLGGSTITGGARLGLLGASVATTEPGKFFLDAVKDSSTIVRLEGKTDGTLLWNSRSVLTAANIDTTVPSSPTDSNVPSTKLVDENYLSKYSYSGTAAMTRVEVAELISTNQLEFATVQFDADNSPDGLATTVWFVELSRGTVQKAGESGLSDCAYMRATSFTSKDQYLCISSDDGVSFGDWTKQSGGGASGDFLKLDGTTTMTGSVVSANSTTLKQSSDTNDTTILGGSTTTTGASLMLAGGSSTTQTAGNFELRLGDGSTALKGNKSDKILSWNGNEIVTVAGATMKGSLVSATSDDYIINGATSTSKVKFAGGPDETGVNDGGRLTLQGPDLVDDGKFAFALGFHLNSTTAIELKGYKDGTLDWNNKNVLLAGDAGPDLISNVTGTKYQYLRRNTDNDAVEWASVEDYLTSIDDTVPLSANMGRELQEQINNLKKIGRFLSTWDCTTGLPGDKPTTLPYTFNTGDWYRVTVVTDTGYNCLKPSGSSWDGETASTTVDSNYVKVGDMYYYTGYSWILMSSSSDYLPLKGGTMLGDIIMSTSGESTYAGIKRDDASGTLEIIGSSENTTGSSILLTGNTSSYAGLMKLTAADSSQSLSSVVQISPDGTFSRDGYTVIDASMIDDAVSAGSSNPVQNMAVKAYVDLHTYVGTFFPAGAEPGSILIDTSEDS